MLGGPCNDGETEAQGMLHHARGRGPRCKPLRHAKAMGGLGTTPHSGDSQTDSIPLSHGDDLGGWRGLIHRSRRCRNSRPAQGAPSKPRVPATLPRPCRPHPVPQGPPGFVWRAARLRLGSVPSQDTAAGFTVLQLALAAAQRTIDSL